MATQRLTVAILVESAYKRVWQPICDGVVGKFARFETAETRVPGANPHRAGMVLIDRVDIRIDESLLLGVHLNKLVMQSIESVALGTEPETTFVVFDDLGKRAWRIGSRRSYAFIDRSS